MYGLKRFGIILGLSTIRRVLKALGNPHRRFTAVHIAGTNGKGSVAAALSSILHTAGHKVGLFTSPHLVRFNERICIDNRQITNADVVDAYRAVKAAHSGDRELTFFEYSAAMAFFAFADKNVDWAVIETGMGGRLDATNIIKPAVSIITNVSLEHRMHLGNTITKIAGEKGGIIKKKVPVVTGVRQSQGVAVLQSIAREKSAPFFRYGKTFRTRRKPDGTFTYSGMESTQRDMKTGLTGSHQVDNAALVLAACELLNLRKPIAPTEAVREGLLNVRWPGRLEIAGTSPLLLLDGAHNFIAARTLKKYLSEHLAHKKITMVIGILDDKPYKSMLQTILPGCRRVIATRANIDRALSPEVLYTLSKRMIEDVRIIPDVAAAVRYAMETTPSEEAVCVAGSLYVVGEAKAWLDKETGRA